MMAIGKIKAKCKTHRHRKREQVEWINTEMNIKKSLTKSMSTGTLMLT